MAQARGIRIHQYLDDWLLRAPCQETCLQHTRTLLALCQNLGWVINLKKSNKESYDQGQLFCQSIPVSHRSVDSPEEAGGFGSTANEAHPVAPEESLACPRVPDPSIPTCIGGWKKTMC